MFAFEATLSGHIPAKKNAWKRSRWGGVYQSKKKEIDDLLWQMAEARNKLKKFNTIIGDAYLNCVIYDNDRCDTLGQLETIGDLLEAAGVVKNDRQIKQIIVNKHIVKKNFRTEIGVDGKMLNQKS